MTEHVNWTVRPGARELVVRRSRYYIEPREYPECLCEEGHQHVEAEWPIHGWTAHTGQCCDCLNIAEYSNGAEPDDWKSEDKGRLAYVEENFDQIHICNLDAFIEMLQTIREFRNNPSSPEPKEEQ